MRKEGSRNVAVSTYGNDPWDPENLFLLLFDGNIDGNIV
jgi:hypothetical protein